jgi:hypothetical protein
MLLTVGNGSRKSAHTLVFVAMSTVFPPLGIDGVP